MGKKCVNKIKVYYRCDEWLDVMCCGIIFVVFSTLCPVGGIDTDAGVDGVDVELAECIAAVAVVAFVVVVVAVIIGGVAEFVIAGGY